MPGAAILLGRKRGHNLLKARVAVQWIPVRMETKFAKSHARRRFDGNGQLFERQFFLSRPRVY